MSCFCRHVRLNLKKGLMILSSCKIVGGVAVGLQGHSAVYGGTEEL